MPTPMQTADCVLLTSIHSLKVNFIKVLYYLVNNTLFLEFRDISCIALHIMLQLRLLFFLTICDNSLRFHIYFLFWRLDLAVLFFCFVFLCLILVLPVKVRGGCYKACKNRNLYSVPLTFFGPKNDVRPFFPSITNNAGLKMAMLSVASVWFLDIFSEVREVREVICTMNNASNSPGC